MTGQEPPPDRLGDYRVLRRLGEGGMGVVYLGADPQGHPVAVKALRQGVAADPNARYRLAREVETMRRVHSPFVAEVIDADVTSEPPYIVTRYVDGRSLEDLVGESGPLSGPALAKLAYGLASALAAVHAAGVVHRDLKPGNVMLSDGKPVVIDFGIAQAPDLTRLTMTGMFMGTPGYLAPEVIEGKQSGPASDVHSWGATVAFAATGRPPFGIGSFETIFYRIVHGQPDLDRFPQPLAPLVSHALARDPARRPSAAELSTRLAALDPASLVAGAAPAAVPGRASGAMPGTITDHRPAAAGRDPRAPAPNGWGQPGAAAAGVAAAATAGRAGRRAAADFGDILPAVQYGQAGPAADRAAPPGAALPAGGAIPAGAGPGRGAAAADGARPARKAGRAGPLLAVATVAVAVSISVLLPVAGTLVALVALVALRAGTLTGRSLTKRRSARGSRVTDPALAMFVLPVALLRSLIRLVLLAPLAIVAGALAAAVTVLVSPAHSLPQAGAYAAGAIVAFYGLGPGSSSSRKPLARFFNALGRNPASATVVFIGMAAVAIGAIAAAATHPPFYWPFSNLNLRLQQLPGSHSLLHDVWAGVLRLIGRQP
jgi:predicted Ser/Thr protein kinase